METKLKCPKCGTPIDPRGMMCIHCGLMLGRDRRGRLKFKGYAKVPQKIVAENQPKEEETTVRVVEADKPKTTPQNSYEQRDAFSTGNLNRPEMDKKSFLKKKAQNKEGLIVAKDIKINDELADLYMGDRGEKLLSLSINIPAFLFGPFWYLYRKQIFACVLYLALYFGVCYAVNLFLPTLPILVVTILFMILNLFFGNKIYTFFVKMYLFFYQLFHRKMSADKFMSNIEIKGGTSFKYVFWGCLLFILGLFAYIYFYHQGDIMVIKEFFL